MHICGMCGGLPVVLLFAVEMYRINMFGLSNRFENVCGEGALVSREYTMLACKYSKEWKSFCLIAVCLYLLCIDYIKNHVRKYQAFRPGTRSPLSRYGFIYIYIYVILVHTTYRHIYTHLRIAIMLLFATFPEKYIYTPDFHIEIIIANKNNTHIYIPSQIRAKRAHRRKFIAALKIVCLCILCVSFSHYLASHHIINVMKAHTEYVYKYITTHTHRTPFQSIAERIDDLFIYTPSF